jgi:hypothetical protein
MILMLNMDVQSKQKIVFVIRILLIILKIISLDPQVTVLTQLLIITVKMKQHV